MKIGLIAMSGIRVCDAELLRLGLTLPGFVERSQVIASLPSLGLLTLAGMTPHTHQVRYIEVADLKQSRSTGELDDDFDLVAISTYSAQIFEAYELADEFRARGVAVVMGGLHVTCEPTEAIQHCDAVVIGEGEVMWPRVLHDAEKKSLKPFYNVIKEEFTPFYRVSKEEFDLAHAPMPAFELLDISKYNRLTVQTSRGCPHRCEFCASSVLLTSHYKQKPAAKVLAEIDRICELWKTPFIEFADDNSLVNHAYWKGLLPGLRERNIKWFVETDVSVAQDTELLKQMRDAGCAQVLIGFESPTRESLDHLDSRNWKHRQWEHYREAVHAIQSHGISVNGCFILGLDGQDERAFDHVVDFVRDAGLHEVQITMLTPFPGTPLYDRLLAENRLLKERAWNECTLFDLTFEPKHIPIPVFRERFHDIAVKLYGDDFTMMRRANFRRHMREGKADAHV